MQCCLFGKSHSFSIAAGNEVWIIAALITVILDSIVVSISACHAEDPGSIPGRGVLLFFLLLLFFPSFLTFLPHLLAFLSPSSPFYLPSSLFYPPFLLPSCFLLSLLTLPPLFFYFVVTLFTLLSLSLLPLPLYFLPFLFTILPSLYSSLPHFIPSPLFPHSKQCRELTLQIAFLTLCTDCTPPDTKKYI